MALDYYSVACPACEAPARDTKAPGYNPAAPPSLEVSCRTWDMEAGWVPGFRDPHPERIELANAQDAEGAPATEVHSLTDDLILGTGEV